MRRARTMVAWCIAAGAMLGAPAAASAEISSVFDGAVECTTGATGVRTCSGIVKTFDGAPVDVNVGFPPAPADGPDGPYPLVAAFHGWGGSKQGVPNRWTNHGYAFFSMSDRGWGASCGGSDPKRLDPSSGCSEGYNHLMDTRFEVRDAQDFIADLVDDGVVDPAAIGATGGSYGGGTSMALAALRDRQMQPDGTLVPWKSDDGTAMKIAAAAPEIPWTDLAYSLQPNGRTLDYVADSPYLGPDGTAPIGVMKQSYVTGLYGTGLASSNYAPPGTDPDADLTTWYALITAGEPYDANPLAADIIDELTSHHSSYYIDASVPPAPLLISNGWTDDLFPVDEAIRFSNRTLSQHPDAKVSMFFLDYGHARGQNKADDTAKLRAAQDAWFAHYLKGEGPEPVNSVTAITQECGGPSRGPFTAGTWADLPKSEIRLRGGADPETLSPVAGDPQRNQAYDPIAGGGACATAAGSDQSGALSYELPPAPAGGFTLMGSPTVVADLASSGPHSQIAARLLDVAPDGKATLVARGVYRLEQLSEAERRVFQLHPNGYRFEEGHVAKLELLPQDLPYLRATNGQAPVTVADLELRLPVLEPVGTAGSAAPAPKVLPKGRTLAPGYAGQPTDADGDGIADGDDDCPATPGAPSSTPGVNGCVPRTADTDGDGVRDESDACPSAAGPASNGGCPQGTTPPPAQDASAASCKDRKVRGTRGADRMRGTSAAETLDARGGDDVVSAAAGADCVRGRGGKDRARGGKGADDVRGGSGRDKLRGDRGADVIRGGSGRDHVRGGRGDDDIRVRDGKRDVVRCGPGDDKVVADERDEVRGCEQVSR